MSCCLSVYFLVVFKRAVDVWFRRAQIVFWVLFIELGGLLTLSVTRLSLATSRFVETLIASPPFAVPKLCAQVPSVVSSPSTLDLSTYNS